jgi:hypothetical protein
MTPYIMCAIFMQVLPFCSEETVAKLEENILKMQPISEAPSDLKASDIVEALLDGIGVGDYNETVLHPFSRLLKDVAFMFMRNS